MFLGTCRQCFVLCCALLVENVKKGSRLELPSCRGVFFFAGPTTSFVQMYCFRVTVSWTLLEKLLAMEWCVYLYFMQNKNYKVLVVR